MIKSLALCAHSSLQHVQLPQFVRRVRPRQQCAVYAWASGPRIRALHTAAPPHAPGPEQFGGSADTTTLLRNVHTGAEIFLVGTAHVSKRSAEEVRETIERVRPHSVFVELCPARARRLQSGGGSDADFLKDALGSLFAPGTNFGQQIFKLSLQGFYRFLRTLGMEVGGEFKAAIDAAAAQGASVVYGDRSVQETLQRLAAAVRLHDVLRMMSSDGPRPPSHLVEFFERGGGEGGGAGMSAFEAQVEAMKTRGMAREMADYLRQLNPQLAAALIDERDEHMARQLAQMRGRVVGVVGLAHLDGIERRWAALQAEAVPPPPLHAR